MALKRVIFVAENKGWTLCAIIRESKWVRKISPFKETFRCLVLSRLVLHFFLPKRSLKRKSDKDASTFFYREIPFDHQHCQSSKASQPFFYLYISEFHRPIYMWLGQMTKKHSKGEETKFRKIKIVAKLFFLLHSISISLENSSGKLLLWNPMRKEFVLYRPFNCLSSDSDSD